MSDQMELNLFSEPEGQPPVKPEKSQAAKPSSKPKPSSPETVARQDEISVKRLDLQRAVMGWLNQGGATGMAAQVPTRVSRYKADVAAYWSQVCRRRLESGPARVLRPQKTVVVEIRCTRSECWPDCGNSEELAPLLRKLRRQQEELQASIRSDEPDLQHTDVLFEEYAEWDYSRTSNAAYHQLCKEIRKIEKSLYQGTKFEGLISAQVADEAYLAVPARALHPREVATGWGLIWVRENLDIEVIAPSAGHACGEENRLHLVQNIGRASRKSVLFANGVHPTSSGPIFLPIPRRRRPKPKS
jgi:hypothetical protein